MDLGKALSDLAATPFKIASVGLEIAGDTVTAVQRGLNGSGPAIVAPSMSRIFGFDDALSRAGRLTRLIDDDAPLGRRDFLRLFTVGVVEDEPIYQGSCLLSLEITE